MSMDIVPEKVTTASPGSSVPAVLHTACDGGVPIFERVGTNITKKRADLLFCEGDPAEFYYKVVTGAVRGCNLLADGRRHVGDFFLPGDFIGLDAAKFYMYSAEVVASTTLVRYARWKVDMLVGQELEIAQSLVTMMRDGLSAARNRMMLLGHMTAMERVANFLLMIAEKTGTSRITLPMTRTDIGDHLGLTIETVSRTFSQLKKDHIIEQKTIHTIRIANRNALVDLADVC
jgi:CRP/FNR family transcriptional regulator, nitrogen fixation regulation protein